MHKETKGKRIGFSGIEESKLEPLVLFCPLQGAIDVISKKWTMLIVNEIGNHKIIRFNELKSELSGITSKALSSTLSDLHQHNLIIKEIFKEIPPRVEYSMTEDGVGLYHAIAPLLQWAASTKDAVVTECSCKAKPKN